MGNKDNHPHHHKVSSFNPTWCLRPPSNNSNTSIQHGNKSPLRSSYHQNRKSHHHQHRKPPQSPTPQLTVEPTSPRVGCMGQIRRSKAQSSTDGSVKSSSSSSSSSLRSSGFSPQNATNCLEKSLPTSVSSSPADITGNFSLLILKRVNSRRVSIVEMDPPRPVEKRVVSVGPEGLVSLWERRCRRGDRLRLQLQPMEQSCA